MDELFRFGLNNAAWAAGLALVAAVGFADLEGTSGSWPTRLWLLVLAQAGRAPRS